MKKAYPQLIASKLVGVQPLSQPASLIHYLRYTRDRRSRLYANGGRFDFAMFDKGYARILELTDEFIIIDADLQTPDCECVRIRIDEENKIEIDHRIRPHGTEKIAKTTVKFEDGTEKEGYHDVTYLNMERQAFKVIWT